MIMNPHLALDYTRVGAALILLYCVLPMCARRMSDAPLEPWRRDIVPAFIRACLFYQVTAIILGNWRLCFAGLFAGLTVLWLSAMMVFASRRRWIWEAGQWRIRFLRLLQWVEGRAWRCAFHRLQASGQRFEWTVATVFTVALLTVVFLQESSFALHNQRFRTSMPYERALSLETLVNGDDWKQDGSVALLAPLCQLAGIDGVTAVRFTAPIFGLLVAAAAAYCAWIFSQRFSAAYIAAGLVTLYSWAPGGQGHPEAGSAEMACVFWILCVALLRRSWIYGLAAGGVAFLTHPQFSEQLAVNLAIIMIALLISAVGRPFPRVFTSAARPLTATLVLAAVLRFSPPLTAADGPFQYEAAARAVTRIKAEFPRNRWMLVSTGQELPFIYGRGWHASIADFVREYSVEEVSRPAFRFPYSADDILWLIEKEPLRQAAKGAAQAADEYSYRYFTQLGRSELEFEAGRRMAAYAATHEDTTVFYEDDQIMIYRIRMRN